MEGKAKKEWARAKGNRFHFCRSASLVVVAGVQLVRSLFLITFFIFFCLPKANSCRHSSSQRTATSQPSINSTQFLFLPLSKPATQVHFRLITSACACARVCVCVHNKMAHHFERHGQHSEAASRLQAPGINMDEEEEEEEESLEGADSVDRIRRSYRIHEQQAAGRQDSAPQANGQPQAIRVTLNESYFAPERRALVNLLANARQKMNSLRLFNPAQNEASKQRQEQWDEKVSSR